MNWQDYFFGFEGRVGRLGYWLFMPIAGLLMLLVMIVAQLAGTLIGTLLSSSGSCR
jgi:uncharacterized membrane protein YhaH (DUF805 family)